MLLTAEAILKADDLPWRDVDVPEWGGTVRVRRLTAYEWRKLIDDAKGLTTNIEARFCAMAMIDADGKQLFTPAQAIELGKKSWPAIQRVYDAAKDLSGFGEDTEKNSESPAATGPSSSDSPDI